MEPLDEKTLVEKLNCLKSSMPILFENSIGIWNFVFKWWTSIPAIHWEILKG